MIIMKKKIHFNFYKPQLFHYSKILINSIIICPPCIPQQANAQKKIWVKYNLKKGGKFISHLTQDIKMKVERNGMEIPMNISSTITSTSEKK